MTFATVGSSTGLAGDRDRRWTPESGVKGGVKTYQRGGAKLYH